MGDEGEVRGEISPSKGAVSFLRVCLQRFEVGRAQQVRERTRTGGAFV